MEKLLKNSIEEHIINLTMSLGEYVNPDGGFRAYHIHDKASGVWTTAEITHCILKNRTSLRDEPHFEAAKNYLISSQNADGGWGFRKGGKSIIDISAWVCLALMNYEETEEQVQKGSDFILKSRVNAIGHDYGGWGLTTNEHDRIYSTWIASYYFIKAIHNNIVRKENLEEVTKALEEAKAWIIRSINEDYGWGPTNNSQSTYTSTALALHTLFIQGENPEKYKKSYKFLIDGVTDGIWTLEREIVVTQEGYELAQEWFTTAFCLKTIIFFAEMKICSIETLYNLFEHAQKLIQNNRVRVTYQSGDDVIWTIPLLIDALHKYNRFISQNAEDFKKFLEIKEIEKRKAYVKKLEGLLRNQYPYPISQVYFAFKHELNPHQKFQYLIETFEVAMRYVTSIYISSIILLKENNSFLSKLINQNIDKPSYGQWVQMFASITKNSSAIDQIVAPATKESILQGNNSSVLDESLHTNVLLNEISNLRNTWLGHGAVRSTFEYKQVIEKYTPLLLNFISRLDFLSTGNSFLVLSSDYDEFGDNDTYTIRIYNGFEVQDEKITTNKRLPKGQSSKEQQHSIQYLYFHNKETNTIVSLYPLISHMLCTSCNRERFFFYNGTKEVKRENKKVTMKSYLSFECGHDEVCDNADHFEKRFKEMSAVV